MGVITAPVAGPAPKHIDGRGPLRAAAAVLVAATAVVPCVFTTRWDDVFYLPKLVVLWVVMAGLAWLLVGAALSSRGRGLRLRFVAAVDAPMAAFVVLNLLALGFSTDRHQSLFGERLQHQGTLTTLLYVGFFYAARIAITNGRRLLVLFGATALGAVLVSGYGIVQEVGLDPIWKGYLPFGRVFSTIGQPNALAAYLVIVIPGTVAWAWARSRWARVVALAASALMATVLLLTYSRGGYLGLAVAAAVTVAAVLISTRAGIVTMRRFLLVLGGVVLAALLALALAAPVRTVASRVWDRATSVSQANSDVSINAHLDEWRVAARIIEARPLLGTGPETFPEQFPAYSRVVLSASAVRYFDQFRVESPHNEVLAVAAGAGVPAALAYLFLVGGVGLTLWEAARRTNSKTVRVGMVALLAVLAGHFVTDSFMSAEITGSWLFWTLMGAGITVAAQASRQAGPTPVPESES